MDNPSIGHNSGMSWPSPDNLATAFSDMVADNKAVVGRANAVPETLTQEAMPVALQAISALKTAIKTVKGEKTSAKDPYLEAGRTIEGFFKVELTALDEAKRTLESRVSVYQLAKAKAEKEAAEAETERLRKDSEALELDKAFAETPAESRNIDNQQQVNAVSTMSAERRVAAPVKDQARVRAGAQTAGLKTVWVGKVTNLYDLDLNKLSQFIHIDVITKAVNAYARQFKEQAKLDGVEFHPEHKTVVRG